MDYFNSLAQAQALATVMVYSDYEPGFIAFLGNHKKVVGPLFSKGDFYTAEAVMLAEPVAGRLDYYVLEKNSRLVLSAAHATRGEALSEARNILQNLGNEAVNELIEDRTHMVVAALTNQTLQRAARQTKPRKIGKRMKTIFEESDGKCHYCATSLVLDGKWQIEHKMPRALGGGDEPTNLVAACVPCNVAKRDRTDVEFFAMRAAFEAKVA